MSYQNRIGIIVVSLTLAILVGLPAAVSGADNPPPVKFDLKTNQKYNLVVLDNPACVPAVEFSGMATNVGDSDLDVSAGFIDVWGKEVQKVRGFTLKPGDTRSVTVDFTPRETGAWTLLLKTKVSEKAGDKVVEQEFKGAVTLAVVPPPIAGPRSESFFASNTHPGGNGERAEFHHLVGLKVYRNHFADPGKCKVPPKKVGDSFEINWEAIDRMMTEVVRQQMTFGVGIVGYGVPLESDEAKKYHQYGPPRDNQEFADIVARIIARYNYLVPYWEIWNEPWIYGWTFAGPPSLYQDLHKRIIATTRSLGCNAQFLCGHSASFLADNIMPDPKCAEGVVGETNHPYKEGGDPNLRKGSQLRYTDYGLQMGKAFGLKKHFITENGTEVMDPVTGTNDSLANVAKLIVLHVQPALCGIYQCNIQEGIGWGQGQARGNVAFAVTSRMLEDRPVVADIWPAHPLIWGAIFANPRHITDEVRKLPRANDLSARWQVPVPVDRALDPTKVAVIWSYTGPDDAHLDQEGTLAIADPGDIKAFDCVGIETGKHKRKSLTVPFNGYPIFLTTDKLTVMELLARVRDARIEEVTPVNFSIQSIPSPLNQKPKVTVTVQNQMNRSVKGKIRLEGPKGWEFADPAQEVELKPAEIRQVAFQIASAAPDPSNLYGLTVSARTDAGKAERMQFVQVACIPKITIKVDGDLSDWKNGVPVSIDSRQVENVEDWTRYALNPNLKRPEADAAKPHVSVKAWAAYDDKNIYLAYAVNEPEFKHDAGQPWGNPPHPKYRKGMLDGINFPIYGGDCIEAVFGFRDRAEDDPRKPGDPWYWKGNFRDTDYQYLLYTSTDGPQFIRIHKPETPYRVSFQCVVHPGQGPVEGGRLVIRRDEQAQMTYYEASMPRSEMPLFKPEAADRIRYAFLVATNEGVGYGGQLQWAQACGVFDYWFNNGSFQPTWHSIWPCQTFWGVGK